ncbi:MAG: MerR family transcriptional regulator [Lachnospiraceae bacterium]
MAKYLLSISEMAELRNITSETLRHYDRIGLLKPEYVTKSKRRMYSIRQYEKLGTILELRAVGMSLDEIKEYFDHRNVRKSVSMLKKHQKTFEKKLEEQIQLNKALLQKIEYMDGLSDLPELETVYEKQFPLRYMVTLGKESGDREEHAMAFTKLENCVREKVPIIASDRVGVYTNERILLPSDTLISAIPMILVSPDHADQTYLREIPEGKYVCMLYQNGILEKYDPSFEKIKIYMRKKGYKICGEILQIYKIDVTLSDDPKETVMEIQIPVK